MKTLETLEILDFEGNTKSSKSKKQSIQRLYWCGTLFNYDDIYEDFIKRLNNICKKYIIGKRFVLLLRNRIFNFFLD
jgi:hypothetical protein